MTFTTLGALLVGRRVGFRGLLAAREELGSVDAPRNTLRLIGQIAGLTLLVEALGAVVLAFGFIRGGLGYVESLFQGVTPRTAGFSTVDYSQMRDPTLLLQIGLMFEGTAPTSTGGGVKVTTLALLVLVVLAQARGQEEVSAFGRQVPRQLTQKVLAVLSLSALLVLAATLALMVSDYLALLPALFEVSSVFRTVGLSMNVTPELTAFGKLLVAGVMFLGRIGPIILILALSARQKCGVMFIRRRT